MDKTAKIWATRGHRLIFTLKKHSRGLRDVAFDPTQTVIATAADDRNILIWDYKTGKLIKALQGHDFVISGIRFSPNGRALVSGSRDKTIRLWNVRKGQFIRTLAGEAEQVTDIAVTPNGNMIAVATLGKEISLLRLPAKIVKSSRIKKAPSQTSTDTFEEEQKTFETDEETQKKSASGQPGSEQDFAEEKEDQKQDSIFNVIEKVVVDRTLESDQKKLNDLLNRNTVCEDAPDIIETANKILNKSPKDRAAYYGLIKAYIVKKDLQMIFLISKLGEKAVYNPQLYDFTTISALNDFFQSWLNIIFNQSTVADENKVKLELIDCNAQIKTLSMPKYLLNIDIPLETTQAILENKVQIDHTMFESLMDEPEMFRNVLFSVIEAIDSGEKKINRKTLKAFAPETVGAMFGYYTVDLSNVQQWGQKDDRIAFQLKRKRGNWLTYLTDTDKSKTLLLKEGNYYLKINKRVRKAFIIDENNSNLRAVIR